MYKNPHFIFALIFSITLLSACSGVDNESDLPVVDLSPVGDLENPVEEKVTKNIKELATENESSLNETLTSAPKVDKIKKYKLVAPRDYEAIYLELYPDLTFKMDFNYCQGIAKGEGKFTMENGLYFLTVENSADMASLSTVNVEAKEISDTELKIVSEVYRTENGEKIYFCTPVSDPENKFEGEEYNIYKLID